MPPSGAADATDAERPPGRSVGEVLSEITAVVGDEQEAGRIVAEVLAVPLSVVVLRSGEALSPGARERAWTMAEMRAAGVPLQHVLGSWGFRSLDVLVDRRSLVPRPETEQLVELALAQLSPGESAQPDAGGRVVAVDLGTGSGVIALSLAVEGPAGLEVWATERSTDALALARANQERVGAQHREVADGVRFLEGSWFEPLPAELRRGVALIVSNPPYVSEAEWATLDPVVRDHDPTRHSWPVRSGWKPTSPSSSRHRSGWQPGALW